VAFSSAALAGAFAGQPSTAQTNSARQQFAQSLLKNQAVRLTWPAQLAMRMQASGSNQLTQPVAGQAPVLPTGTAGSSAAAPAIPSAGLPNVRVNNPAQDNHQVDQTTQSETTIAVHGSNVAVGFNDSQQGLLVLTAGAGITAYAYSTNGGASFTDGGNLPNTPEFVNFGDPWMGSNRAGTMFYSTLAADFFNGNLDVAVARSTNGGKTWSTPVPVFRPTTPYMGDKDALAVGRDPVIATRDNLYVAYDDFAFDPVTSQQFTGLPVVRSLDGGRTWQLHYADRFTPPKNTCDFQQYIGAQPLVNPANGTLYVAAEKISVTDPTCTGNVPTTFSEVIFKSTDGGVTFPGGGTTIATVTPATPTGLLFLGAGRYARTIEFPSIALRGSTLWVAWNDGGLGDGRSHIRLARSTDGGSTWNAAPFVTSGSGNEIQPAVSTVGTALRLLYYHSYPNNAVDTIVGNSLNGGTSFITTRRVTSVPFRGSLTVPQFDPVVAVGYMGDYIANVVSGSHAYYAWGDNRDTVTNFMYPQGRNDPDVFFAKQ
jgi:hypothetical protein